MRIAVTGSNGKLGRAACALLKGQGHKVAGFDIAASGHGDPTVKVDCTQFGAVMGALSGVDAVARSFDAVLHLAGIPRPGATTDEEAFRINIEGTYAVFSAATRLGIPRVVWASSETVLGLPFAEPPSYAPVDEDHPRRPNWSYALAKMLGEDMADQFVRWNSRMGIVSLRFSNILDAQDYDALPPVGERGPARAWNLWSYVDIEDAARACALALTTPVSGHQRLIIAAADNLAGEPSRTLMETHFPGVPLPETLAGEASLLSSARAAERIGYRAQVSWRDRDLSSRIADPARRGPIAPWR